MIGCDEEYKAGGSVVMASSGVNIRRSVNDEFQGTVVATQLECQETILSPRQQRQKNKSKRTQRQEKILEEQLGKSPAGHQRKKAARSGEKRLSSELQEGSVDSSSIVEETPRRARQTATVTSPDRMKARLKLKLAEFEQQQQQERQKLDPVRIGGESESDSEHELVVDEDAVSDVSTSDVIVDDVMDFEKPEVQDVVSSTTPDRDCVTEATLSANIAPSYLHSLEGLVASVPYPDTPTTKRAHSPTGERPPHDPATPRSHFYDITVADRKSPHVNKEENTTTTAAIFPYLTPTTGGQPYLPWLTALPPHLPTAPALAHAPSPVTSARQRMYPGQVPPTGLFPPSLKSAELSPASLQSPPLDNTAEDNRNHDPVRGSDSDNKRGRTDGHKADNGDPTASVRPPQHNGEQSDYSPWLKKRRLLAKTSPIPTPSGYADILSKMTAAANQSESESRQAKQKAAETLGSAFPPLDPSSPSHPSTLMSTMPSFPQLPYLPPFPYSHLMRYTSPYYPPYLFGGAGGLGASPFGLGAFSPYPSPDNHPDGLLGDHGRLLGELEEMKAKLGGDASIAFLQQSYLASNQALESEQARARLLTSDPAQRRALEQYFGAQQSSLRQLTRAKLEEEHLRAVRMRGQMKLAAQRDGLLATFPATSAATAAQSAIEEHRKYSAASAQNRKEADPTGSLSPLDARLKPLYASSPYEARLGSRYRGGVERLGDSKNTHYSPLKVTGVNLHLSGGGLLPAEESEKASNDSPAKGWGASPDSGASSPNRLRPEVSRKRIVSSPINPAATATHARVSSGVAAVSATMSEVTGMEALSSLNVMTSRYASAHNNTSAESGFLDASDISPPLPGTSHHDDGENCPANSPDINPRRTDRGGSQIGEEKEEMAARKGRSLEGAAVAELQRWYETHSTHPYPTDEEVDRLATHAGISAAQVRKWMANKRLRTGNTLPGNGACHLTKVGMVTLPQTSTASPGVAQKGGQQGVSFPDQSNQLKAMAGSIGDLFALKNTNSNNSSQSVVGSHSDSIASGSPSSRAGDRPKASGRVLARAGERREAASAVEGPPQGGSSSGGGAAAGRPKAKRLLNPRAVEAMNAWYREHIAYPYPSDEEKQRLAESTGITVPQVTCWFANKRNRSNNTRRLTSASATAHAQSPMTPEAPNTAATSAAAQFWGAPYVGLPTGSLMTPHGSLTGYPSFNLPF